MNSVLTEFPITGVLGSYGKTSISWLLEKILQANGKRPAVIGSLSIRLGDWAIAPREKPPSPAELESVLANFYKGGATGLLIEVSDRALTQGRMDFLRFQTGIFANLHDELELGSTWLENARKQTCRFFSELLAVGSHSPSSCVMNSDDPFSSEIETPRHAHRFSFGSSRWADFRYEVLNATFDGSEFRIHTPDGVYTGETQLCGPQNISNIVAAICASWTHGVSIPDALGVISRTSAPLGRLEKIPNTRGLHIFVDDGSTLKGLELILAMVRELIHENFRSSQLRVIAGVPPSFSEEQKLRLKSIVDAYADHISYVTDDRDRMSSIKRILEESNSGDVLVLTGKAHLDWQSAEGLMTDRNAVMKALEEI